MTPTATNSTLNSSINVRGSTSTDRRDPSTVPTEDSTPKTSPSRQRTCPSRERGINETSAVRPTMTREPAEAAWGSCPSRYTSTGTDRMPPPAPSAPTTTPTPNPTASATINSTIRDLLASSYPLPHEESGHREARTCRRTCGSMISAGARFARSSRAMPTISGWICP